MLRPWVDRNSPRAGNLFMKSKRRWNERTRMILILELAVVLPAAALVILSALHLKTVQSDHGVEAAIQRDFTQFLGISEKQMNQKAIDLMDDVRADFPAPRYACVGSLDKILAAHPYIAHVVLYTPRAGMLFRSQPSREGDSGFDAESDYLRRMDDSWMKLEFDEYVKKMEAKKHSSYGWDASWPMRGDRHLYQSSAYFLLIDPESGEKALAGISFDAEYLRDK